MLAGISGTVFQNRGQSMLIRVGPLTLLVEMPLLQAAEFRAGDAVELHTYLHFSSNTDQLRLFAFTSALARDLFTTLISGSGVGPKVALALLELDVIGLVAAIRDGNEKALTSVPGVGPKLAKKIILELSDKVSKEFSAAVETGKGLTRRSSQVEDALDAVAALGFTRLQAEQALARAKIDDPEIETADLIRLILASLSRT